MVDPQSLGTSGEPFPLDVERGKVREFARAVRSTDPSHLEGEHPVAPPTFLTTTMHWQPPEADPWDSVAMDQQRGLHAEQEYVFHGAPPRAGDRLTCRSTIADIYTRQGRRGGELTFVVMHTSFHDERGELVAEARMTAVETARPPVEPSA